MPIEQRIISDRSEWLQWRMHDVTASDIAPVLGLHPDRTVARVWAEKTGLILPDGGRNNFLEFRASLEAAAIDWTRVRRPGWDIRRGKVYLRDPELRLGATPDAVAVDPAREGIGVLEVKSVARSVYERDWKQDEEDEERTIAPIWHQLQALTGAMLVGASWITVIGLVLDNAGTGALKFCAVERNAEAERRIKDGISRFWAMTDCGRQPPFDYGLDGEVIAALYPKARILDPPLDLSQDNLMPELLNERLTLKREMRERDKRCETIDAEIKDKLGEHQLATMPGWRISWKTQKRAERITPAWEGRVLHITATKDKP